MVLAVAAIGARSGWLVPNSALGWWRADGYVLVYYALREVKETFIAR